MLGPLATAYEQTMTEGEGKNTWRLDRYSPCPRQEACRSCADLAAVQCGGHEAPAVGHEEGTVTSTESDRISGTLHCRSVAER
jgi:hypothetical protein